MVGPEAEQERGAGAGALQGAHQRRHALARSTQGIDVDFKCDQHDAGARTLTDLQSGRPILVEQVRGERQLPAVGFENLLQRLAHRHARLPPQFGAGVIDLGHSVGHVLVTAPVIFTGGRVHQLYLGGIAAILRVFGGEFEQLLGQLAHREVVVADCRY